MARFIDMTDAQKGRVWERHVAGNAPAIASWIDNLRKDYKEARPQDRPMIAQKGARLQALYQEATGHRYP